MKTLRYLALFLMIILGISTFAQPGYYPPPASVDYHNDTLTIFPPDSLPGDPVVLIAYNIYVDSAFFDNIPVINPSDNLDYIFTFPALPPGDHAFCADAVYNQWISEPACDSATVIYGYELPFLEDWSSGSFETLQWTADGGNWIMNTEEGNPAPTAEFRGDLAQTDYEMSLESYPISALGINVGRIWFEFSLKLDCIHPTGDELLKIQVWNWISQTWTTVAEYYNDEGSFAWMAEHFNIKSLAMNKVFKVRFLASGINSADIDKWYVDNIHIYRTCFSASDLVVDEYFEYNELDWLPPYTPTPSWIAWDDGMNSGNSAGTGGAAEFDVAARWEPAQLVGYDGAMIKAIGFFPAEPAATYSVRIWTGPGQDSLSLVVDQTVIDPQISEWNYINLANPHIIDASLELWIGYHVDTPTGYPAGVDDGPAIDGYGNMMNFGGWQTLLEINPDLDYNWNIMGFFVTFPNPEDPEVYFNIYRKTNNEEYVFLNTTDETNYRDNDIILSDYYCYQVTVSWIYNGDSCESVPTNTACESINIGINQVEQDFRVNLYPNPTNSYLNIESGEEIRIITLYNLLGEEILNLEIGNLEYRLDVSSLQDGIYYVTVETGKRDFKAKVIVLK